MTMRPPTTSWPDRISVFLWVRLPLRTARLSMPLGASLTDGFYLTRWPSIASMAPGLALLVGVALGARHPGATFTQSLFIMALGLIPGLVSCQLGAWTVAGYVLGDLLTEPPGRFHLESAERFTHVYLPLFLSYSLLALLWIAIPLSGSLVRAQVRSLSLPAWVKSGLEITVYVGVVTTLIHYWAPATAVLIRPVYTWSGSSPPVEAIQPLQENASLLIWVAAAVCMGRLILERVASNAQLVANARVIQGAFSSMPLRHWSKRALVVRAIIAAGFTTLLLSGLISGWGEGVTVFVYFGFLLSLRNLWQNSTGIMVTTLGKIPIVIRFIMATLLSSYMARIIVGDSLSAYSTFRPILISSCVCVGVITLLTVSPRRGSPENPRGQSRAARAMTTARRRSAFLSRVLLSVGVILLTPSPAGADNCSGLLDCFSGLAAALAAIAAIAVTVAAIFALAALFGGLGGGIGALAFAGGGSTAAGGAVAAAEVAAVAAAEVAAVAAAAAAAAEAAGNTSMMSSGERPGSNTPQNKQVDDAIREYERQTGRKVERRQREQLHRDLQHGDHGSPGYWELVEILKDLIGR